MAEQSPLVRQWIVLQTLSARRFGATIKELAREMGVSEKTVRRDLEMFEAAGFPLIDEEHERGRKTWRLAPTANRPELAFAFDEAVALYLARRLLEPLAGTPFWRAAQSAFKKIRASLGPEAIRYAARFNTMFHQTMVGASDYTQKTELIDELLVGIEDRRAVFLTYQSLRATEPVTYDIWPFGLTYHRGSLYLVGCTAQNEEIRHWKVDRIEAAEVTPVHFTPPEDFDLHEHLSHSFGVYHGDGQVAVTVRFSSTVARYVEESNWHESQRLERRNDGGLVARFELSNTEEIKRWIMSFGRHAVVIEPEELREEIVEELTALAEAYEDVRRDVGL